MAMSSLYLLTALVAFLLYAAILHLLLRSHLRRYFILFLYMLVLLFTATVDGAFAYGGVQSFGGYSAANIFYFNDLTRQTFAYVLVISMVFGAARGSERFRWLGRWFLIGAVLLAGSFLWLHYDPERLVRWMTNVVRNLSLVGMLMTLALWMLLLIRRTKDRTLLLVVTGLGLQLAGEAIGQSLRLMSRSTITLGNLVVVSAHLMCLAVWFSAFRKRPTP